MKPFFKLPAIVLFTTGLIVFVAIPPGIHPFGLPGVRQAFADTMTVPASLPESAQIILNNGDIWEGQVVRIDASRQTITLRRRSEQTFPIGEIKQISFSGSSVAVGPDGSPILRGDSASPAGPPVTWNPVAISGLRLNSQPLGAAQIVLGSSVSNVDRSGQWTYVLNELRFNPQQGTMTIVATPY